MENPTRESLRKFKVVDLRQMLSERSLSYRGIKEDLITRLLEHHQAEQESKAAELVKMVEEETVAASPEEEDSPPAESVKTEDQPMDESPLEEMDIASTAVTVEDKQIKVETAAMVGATGDEQERGVIEEMTEMSSHQSEAMEVTGNEDETVNQQQETTAAEVPAVQVEPSHPVGVSTPPVDEPVKQPTSDRPSTEENVDHSSVTQSNMTLESTVPESVTNIPDPVDVQLQEPETAPTSALVDQSPPTVVSAPPTSDYFSATDSSKEEDSNTTAVVVPSNEQGSTLDSNVTNATPDVSVTNEQGRPPVMGPPTPLFEPKLMEAITKPTNDTQPKEKGKRKKKKKRRRKRHDQKETTSLPVTTVEPEPDVEIEYIQEEILKPGDPNYRQFHKIFEAFKIEDRPEEPDPTQTVSDLVAKAAEASKKLAAQHKQESSDEEEEEENEVPKISKKKLRKMNRLTVAQLKQLVDRPDVVEMHDVTAQDPKLLISLKSTRNTVPVPRHWCFKRKYLQGKRGFEKPPFNLPDFIKATGVMEMRQAVEEKEDAKSLKQKTRERVRPKMGKLTIDYQKLHDAFFKWQTKPKMSIHGDLYYEGKEFETRLKQKRPGDLSDELRRALGMPTGLGKQKFPPPWLVAMQRYGPPPSYPNLKIPGLNAPIPENCSFGYFVGGWGKPPVDEGGRPLYGDVFGLDKQESGHREANEEELNRSLWGELESEEEEEESEEESEEEEGEPKPEDIQAGLVTPMEGLVTPSGLTSIPAGLETPEMIQLRKKKIEEAMEQGGETPALYTVLPEMTSSVGGAMMGSSHVYDIGSGVPGAAKKTTGSLPDGIEVALDPSELDLDTATMTARYEEQLREQQNQLQKEDLSDMVAEHAAKQQKKRKRAAADTGAGKATKKLKEFKF